jgi:stage II sporulation protein GA (sporulation sigma-E factor processing peptidase)
LTLYLDIIWLLNFLFDSLLLYLTRFILKRRTKKWRVFLGGFFGSLIIFAPLTPFAMVSSTIFKIFISILMVIIAFGFKRMKYFLVNLAVFYLVTFATGGAMIGVHYLMNFDYNLANALFLPYIQGFGDPISWIFVILGFPIVWYLSKNTFEQFENVKIQADQLIDLDVFIFHQPIRLKGLVDSGNQLYDPLTKRPVMIVSLDSLSEYLPNELRSVFENVNQFLDDENVVPVEWMNRLSVVPYRVVGQDHQLIVTFRPDKVILYQDKEVLQTEKVLIGIVNQKLSSDDTFDSIIHPKIITIAKSQQVS